MRLKILDILLMPKSFYSRIKDKKSTLILGILLVGIINTVSSLNSKSILNSKSFTLQNIVLICVFIIAFGLIDVFFFSKPLSDIFNHFTKSKDIDKNETLVKVMKIYITAHLTMLIYLTVSFISLLFPVLLNNILWGFFIILFNIIIPVWFSAIITRGLNVIYTIQEVYRGLIFIAVYLWGFLEGSAIGYMFDVLMNRFIS